jgi:hypothetical protein
MADDITSTSAEVAASAADLSHTFDGLQLRANNLAVSAVYFAVDFDATAGEIRSAIIPYFRGVARAFAESNGLPVYRVGVYGSGAVCQAVLDAKLAELAWLSCSSGWSGSKTFVQSGRWTLRQHLPALVGGLDADPNERNPQHPDIGDFVPGATLAVPAPPPVTAAPTALRRFERLRRAGDALRGMFHDD